MARQPDIDLDQFIPEQYKERSENLIGKVVDLLQQFLNGNIDSDFHFETEVNDITNYWDVLRNDYEGKVRDLVDPYNISSLILKDQTRLKSFLYQIGGMYAYKGTIKMLNYIIGLANMKVDVIPWYDERYDFYVATGSIEKKECSHVMRIYIGDNPLNEEIFEIFYKLMDVLLDVCLQFPLWVMVKNLKDDCPPFYDDLQVEPNMGFADRYSRCGIELFNLYGQRTFYAWEADRYKGTPPRFLSADESTKYQCTFCKYVYDPIYGDGRAFPGTVRTPFVELPHDWTCPHCGYLKAQFSPIEFDPSAAFQAIKWILLSMINNHELRDLSELIASFDSQDVELSEYNMFAKVVNYGKDLPESFLFQSLIYHDFDPYLLTCLLRLLQFVEEDEFKALLVVGMQVNPTLFNPYATNPFYGAPYIQHGDANSGIHGINHKLVDGSCPHWHNGVYSFINRTREFYSFSDTASYHVKDPVIRYVEEGYPCFTHNYQYKRSKRFNLRANPRERCTFNTTCSTPEGHFVYPRHGGHKAANTKYGDLFYGLVDGHYYSEIWDIVQYLTSQGEELKRLTRHLSSTLSYMCLLYQRDSNLSMWFQSIDEFNCFSVDKVFISNLKTRVHSQFTTNQYDRFVTSLSYLESINSLA